MLLLPLASWNKASVVVANITLPQGLKKIGFWAFSDCTNLTSINFPDSIETIGESAFQNCGKLTGPTRLPSSIKEVGDMAFMGCRNLHMSVNHPGNHFLYQYKDSGVTDITLNLEASGNTVYPGGFTGCPSLAGINVKGNSVSFKSVDGVLYFSVRDYKSGKQLGWSLAKYPAGKNAGGWSLSDESIRFSNGYQQNI